jgi:hypothetical protein
MNLFFNVYLTLFEIIPGAVRRNIVTRQETNRVRTIN